MNRESRSGAKSGVRTQESRFLGRVQSPEASRESGGELGKS